MNNKEVFFEKQLSRVTKIQKVIKKNANIPHAIYDVAKKKHYC